MYYYSLSVRLLFDDLLSIYTKQKKKYDSMMIVQSSGSSNTNRFYAPMYAHQWEEGYVFDSSLPGAACWIPDGTEVLRSRPKGVSEESILKRGKKTSFPSSSSSSSSSSHRSDQREEKDISEQTPPLQSNEEEYKREDYFKLKAKIWSKEYDLQGRLLHEEGVRDHRGKYVYDDMPGEIYVNKKEPTYTWHEDVDSKKARIITGSLTKEITGYRITRYSKERKAEPKPPRNRRPRIVKCAARGDLITATALLKENKGCVNETCEAYLTPLMWACRRGDWDMARLFLLNGADVNRTDKEMRTALMIACREGYDNIIESLLYFESYIDSVDADGRTALMLAASKGRSSAVKLLIDCPYCTIDLVNDMGRSALMYACRDGHYECVELLVQAGADVNRRDVLNRTSLMFAAYGAHSSIVKLLIDNDVDVTLRAMGQVVNDASGYVSADGWTARDWALSSKDVMTLRHIEVALSKLAGLKYVNNTDGPCQLFAKGRGQVEMVECIGKKEKDKVSLLRGFVPNPWGIKWILEDEFPSDFVFPPLERRHYCF